MGFQPSAVDLSIDITYCQLEIGQATYEDGDEGITFGKENDTPGEANIKRLRLVLCAAWGHQGRCKVFRCYRYTQR